jgi:tRNA(Arg) A34 adenosine deaminase TadA
MMNAVDSDRIAFALPDWVRDRADSVGPLAGDEARMRFVIDLSREQVVRGTGGPFAAAVFESATGRLVAPGVNLVEHARNSVLHAEVVALMLAEQRLGSYSLSAAGLPPLELVTSSTPCAMCLGAVLWSGVRRLVCAARTEDVRAIGFDEGPVYPDSFAHLERRGIAIVRDVCRDEAARVLREYAKSGGLIYNP